MTERVFKTKGFSAAAKKALIDDDELCNALEDVRNGQADDLGGGVWKKRLNNNRHRSIILAKGRFYWIYQFVFAKQTQSNISKQELLAFRKLAKVYEKISCHHVQMLLDRRELTEICHAKEN
ncbi:MULTISPECIES: type II toxin-antitoxin system RelE/ParE family toxin [Pseudomonas]|jgi:hypothetical protein|uniref:RelE family toxin-antitoxin system n=1 Tax=Pseudomonas lutea TaxID=243924 RepID=A0A9X0JK77_9PSED|nr:MULTISPECIES: type II toxin-antitoxin system RelE/ParE family toxin [Pseudomonas]KGF65518.1 RelE family toxin-antitoxin system [Pseudomonas lutea]MBD8120852.1 type II toxin-antitoxin system RelE/ParE family toxin [Pseudomonas lutea]